MKFITRFSVISKIIFYGLTLVLVKEPEDFILVPVFNAAAVLIPGVFAQFHVANSFGIRFLTQPMIELRTHLMEGFHIFLSRVYVNLYSSFNILILGLLSGYTAVGIYSAAAKVIEAMSMIFIPANNAVFPYLSRLWKEESDAFYGFVRNLRKLFLITGSLMAVAVFILADPITILVNGKGEPVITTTLRILALKLPVIALGPLYTSILINQNRNEDYLWVVRNTLIFSVILTTAGIYFLGTTGLAWSVVGVSIIHQLLFNQKKALHTLPVFSIPITGRV
jgi:PST family polysaccharide transporter